MNKHQKTFKEEDLPDILAYYGCKIEFSWGYNDHKEVASTNPTWLRFMKMYLDNAWYGINSVTLHLRSLSILTDKELITLFETAFGAKADFPLLYKDDYYIGVNDTIDGEVKKIIFWYDGHVFTATEQGGTDLAALHYSAVLTRQLQKWGYYVPGTINEQYVKLIQ